MILLLDNYDSFTFNLSQLIAGFGVEVRVVRNDALSVDQLLDLGAQACVLSPGPGRPGAAGVMGELIAALPDEVPLLGVCLGHQALAESLGGELLVQAEPVHGRASEVLHTGSRLLTGLPSPFLAARYHSLHVNPEGLPAELQAVAWTRDGILMALEHKHLPRFGVQFHPESILMEGGERLMRNFLDVMHSSSPSASRPPKSTGITPPSR